MASVTAPDGETFDDGTYSGICFAEKQLRAFDGIVSLTEGSRIIATGLCDGCSTPITCVLYTP